MPEHSYALDTTWRTLLGDLGVVPADVLRRAGLPDDLFAQPSARLAPADYYRLWRSIEAATDDPAFPVRLCQAVRAESCSPPLFAALCSPNFVVAAQRIAQYKKLVAPMRIAVSQDDDVVAVELSWLDGQPTPPASLVLMELLFCVTLARLGTRGRIEAEGTTYQRILDTTRTDLAMHYLESTALSVAEISFLLGFSEPNSFYRAFRAWTDTTPDHVRRAVPRIG